MKKKNVLFLASWYPTRVHETSGNFNEKFAQAVALMNNVYVLHVIADQNASIKEEIVIHEEEHLKTILIYFRKKEKESLLDKLRKAFRYFHYYKKGFHLICSKWGRPEIVHNNVLFPVGMFAFFLKKKYRIPYISTEHWTGYLAERRVKISRWRLKITKMIAKNADRICPVTESLKKNMLEVGLKGDYTIVPNVVNHELFFPSKTENVSNRTRFLHISTCNDAHKNISGMLRAFYRLYEVSSDVELKIITEGNPDEVMELVTNSGISSSEFLTVEGRKNPEQIAEEYRKADVFVLFSNFETFSIVLAEACSSGLPVVYSKCGGLTDIDNPEVGIQISPRNELELFEALNKVVKGEVEFNRDAILAQAKGYHASRIAEKFSSVYSEVLDKGY